METHIGHKMQWKTCTSARAQVMDKLWFFLEDNYNTNILNWLLLYSESQEGSKKFSRSARGVLSLKCFLVHIQRTKKLNAWVGILLISFDTHFLQNAKTLICSKSNSPPTDILYSAKIVCWMILRGYNLVVLMNFIFRSRNWTGMYTEKLFRRD